MAAPTPARTFADLAREGLEVEVVCQKCGRTSVIDPTAPALRDKRIGGRRYRCSAAGCRGIGLPSLKPKTSLWAERLARHAANVRK
ncbi:MAG: hypothetical protein KIS73_28620 [Enhydrobacter sp.]|nr:hypothetical protein [Enhydrobacter sp.]